MSANVDPTVKDLLAAIYQSLDAIGDWRTVAIRSSIGRVLNGTDDPGAAADWLREFLAQRAEHERHLTDGRTGERDPQTDWLTADERARFATDKEAADAP